MASAAAAASRSFGRDRGLPFPLRWLARTDVLLLAGGNPIDTMPPLDRYLAMQRAKGRTIVVDPRRTKLAANSTLHLQVAPGTDAILEYGLLHLLVVERLVDERHVGGTGGTRAPADPNDERVCVCREVSRGEIRGAIADGAHDAAEIGPLAGTGCGTCRGELAAIVIAAQSAIAK